MEPIQVIRGMRDILPEQVAWWSRMESKLNEVLGRFGYQEIRTPFLEQTELFSRSIGEETDIVEKEMYTFPDRDGSSLTLRPEGTAAVIRSYIENNRWKKEPVTRWYYLGPMFRHERPQKGRYRQFSQVGAELIGSAQPAADVEMIDLMVECISAIGLTDTSLQLNSLGCLECRPAYRVSLIRHLEGNKQDLCENCQRRMTTNPLRILDCKEEKCIRIAEQAPRISEALCETCSGHFRTVQDGLDKLSLPYTINHRMVRGLDYYTRTTFELVAEGLGAQNAVAAGGRYDGLVATLGGPDTPGIGFAAGLDRILLKLLDSISAPALQPGVFVVTHGEEAWQAALPLMQSLRRAGLKVMSDVRQGSMKSQMKRADKAGCRFVVMIGEDEIREGQLTIKDLDASPDSQDKQFKVSHADLQSALSARLGIPEATS